MHKRVVPTGVTTTVCSPGASIDSVKGDTQSTCGCASTWQVYASTSEPPNRSSNRVARVLFGVTVNAVSAHTGGGGGGGAGGGAGGGGEGTGGGLGGGGLGRGGLSGGGGQSPRCVWERERDGEEDTMGDTARRR
jgi:hypothetical protein